MLYRNFCDFLLLTITEKACYNFAKRPDMDEKCRRIARPKGVSLKTALVYDGELAPSVEADGYFDAIIPARRLLGL